MLYVARARMYNIIATLQEPNANDIYYRLSGHRA